MNSEGFDRRSFLGSLAAATAGLLVARSFGGDEGRPRGHADRFGPLLPMRRLGRSGEKVTMLGVGGSHLSDAMSEDEARRCVDVMLERGIRFVDSAESYGSHGRSEKRIGKLIAARYRESMFLMTKTRAFDGKTARHHLDQSLKRMNCDYLDLWQIHDLAGPADVDRRIDAGVVDVLLEARQAKKVRYIGFTGHCSPEAHLRMFEQLEQRGVAFDACQMPINVVEPSHERSSFVRQVVPVAIERGYGVLAMKTLAYGRLLGRRLGWGRMRRVPPPTLVPGRLSLAEALGFVWSLPVSVLISGMSSADEMRQNCDVAARFTQLDEAARKKIIDTAAAFAGDAVEFYKAV